ncbi:hypothetical protein Pan97_45000 [Bremerella volcania]|uniref:Uncharacterized protein n=1 Tax=Bremerella volcania TaxID=2527984 RepID=A0A518CDX8_9BACT|nr:hypothetical protein [Bremerella volcania]QDU77430.1 hypothetical protein Pan97_45000 [Bremerella volcania]
MTIRTLVVMLTLIAIVPGCHTWGWGAKQPEQDTHLVDNFTDNQSKSDEDDKEDDFVDSATYAKRNGRTEDPGSGLSDRSRQIERNLGYR